MSIHTPERAASTELPRTFMVLALGSALAALFGAYWDDAWHTGRGRDGFFIAPHIAIYLGVALAGAVLAVHVARVIVRDGRQAVLQDRPLTLAVVAVAATLASGPIDNAWHIAFGRDAVLWSPPHMLGIAGTLTLGATLLSFSVRRPALSAVAGGLVVAAATFPVAEYETDVPQFSGVWFLPVLATGAAIAFAFVSATSSGRRWPTTRAAAVHLMFMILITVFLAVQDGLDAPALPLLVLPAFVLDAVGSRVRGTLVPATAFVVALFATYVPFRSGQVTVGEAVAGLPVALVAVWVVLAVAAGNLRRPTLRQAVVAVIALCLLLPGAALAHDPGQGTPAGTASLDASADGHRLTLRGTLRGPPCSDAASGRLVARRGGRTRSTALKVAGCSFAGTVPVSESGRWFLYADVDLAGRTVETWLPVQAGGTDRVQDAARFAYVPRRRPSSWIKVVTGAVIYAAMAALLAAAFVLIGQTRCGGAVTAR